MESAPQIPDNKTSITSYGFQCGMFTHCIPKRNILSDVRCSAPEMLENSLVLDR